MTSVLLPALASLQAIAMPLRVPVGNAVRAAATRVTSRQTAADTALTTETALAADAALTIETALAANTALAADAALTTDATLAAGAAPPETALSGRRTVAAGTSRSCGTPAPAGTTSGAAAGTRPVAGVVVAGLAACGRTALITELLEHPADSGCDAGPSYRVFRSASTTRVRAYVPGHRSPRRLSGVSARPPRRVEIDCAAPLLAEVELIDSPLTDDFDTAYTEIAIDAAQHAGALLFVTSAASTLVKAEVDFLRAAAARVSTVFVALTGTDQHPTWRDVLTANQAVLAGSGSLLAGAKCLPAGPADLPDLSRELTSWARSRAAGPAPRQQPTRARRIPVDPATTEGWRERLEARIRGLRTLHAEWLAADLSALHDRCVAQLTGADRTGGADLLDRELHAISVRTTRDLVLTAEAELLDALSQVLECRPDPAVLRRATNAVTRAVDSTEQALMVTATSAVAVIEGGAAVSGLAAYPARPGREPIIGAVGVALTDSCYAAWQRRCDGDRRLAREWLHRAVQAIGVELHRQVDQRLDDLQYGISTVVADAVDHGVLLA